jgi:acetyl-CoA C-acetyltransferase
MEKYGTTRDQLAQVAVKNHKHGALNANAHFQKEVSLETVLTSQILSDPLRVFDTAPASDGAAAVVLAALDVAESYTDRPIRVAGVGQGSDYVSLAARETITSFVATKAAAERAFRQAKWKPKDIDVLEVHDSYTINEILALEDLGFCKPGTAGAVTVSGATAIGGERPVNPSGGLKARGHPVGATGIAQAAELVTQLRNRAGARQVKGAKRALALNTGGTGIVSVIHLLEAV